MQSYTLGLEMIGLKEMQRAFSQAPATVSKHLSNAIQKTAFFAEAKAKEYSPIKYGVLRASIHTEGPKGTGLEVEAIVGTNVKYGEYQEKGTGIYAGRGMIYPKTKKLLAWKSDGKWHFARAVRGVRPKWFFKRARDEARQVLGGFLKTALASITSDLAR